MEKTILIVAAHPDDEVIGCGGTIAKHILNNDAIHILFICDGVSSRDFNIKNELAARKKSCQRALETLGVKNHPIFLDFPDNAADSIPLIKIIKGVEEVVKKIKPETIYTHHFGDLNIDHEITHRAVLTACRPLQDSTVKEILTFEILSSSEWQSNRSLLFVPNYFVDITKQIDLKHKALLEYQNEMRSNNHPRSVNNIINFASIRGKSVGLEYAEAFQLIRKIRA